jgi:hypothetical protein
MNYYMPEGLDEKLDEFFEKAEGIPRETFCRHEWVNMGFTSMSLVCKKCNKDKPDDY